MSLITKPRENKNYKSLDESLSLLKKSTDVKTGKVILKEMIDNLQSQKMAQKLHIQADNARDLVGVITIAYNIVLSSEGNATYSSRWK